MLASPPMISACRRSRLCMRSLSSDSREGYFLQMAFRWCVAARILWFIFGALGAFNSPAGERVEYWVTTSDLKQALSAQPSQAFGMGSSNIDDRIEIEDGIEFQT